MNKVLTGAIAGMAATAPMTVAMTEMHKLLPPAEQYPLPPRVITENVLAAADAETEAAGHKTKLTIANHFAYGSAMGAIYGAGLGALDVKPSVPNGVGFGLGVWAVSYLGLLPAVGLFPSASQQPARRNALMIAAHVVWGASLALLQRSAASGK
jgi:uncharacterized membrane protein YagU involved in acid resistance